MRPTVSRNDALIELARRKQLEYWRLNPLKWLEERLGENPRDFKWSEMKGFEKHQWDGDKDCLASVWELFGDALSASANGEIPDWRFAAIESATGTGKTYFLARLVLWFLDTNRNSLVVTSAPSETQLKMGLWSEIANLFPKIKKSRPYSEKWKLRVAMDIKQKDLADSWHAIGFVTGTNANEESSNRARGFHRKNMLIILEECTGIPPSILTAFQNTCTANANFILGVGNPNNEFDTLHRFATQDNVRNFRLSAFDHPNIVLKKEHFSGAVTETSLKDRSSTYVEGSAFWNAMVRGICPTTSVDSLVNLKWMEAVLNIDVEPEFETETDAVGVDVANSTNGDKGATAWGHGSKLTDMFEFVCPNATHLGYNLILDDVSLADNGYLNYGLPTIGVDYDIPQEYIGIDAVGVGVATVNALLDEDITPESLQGGQWKEVIPTVEKVLDGNTVEVPMYKFPSLRSQMYWEFREDIRLKKLSICIANPEMRNQLIKEATIPKYDVSRGYITVESKESIRKRLGKSPNVLDCAVYWNWIRKGYRVNPQTFYVNLSGGS